MLLLDYMQDSDTEKWETPTYEEIDHIHIPLSKGLFAKVSVEDFDRVNQFKWSASINKNKSYGVRAISKKITGGKYLIERLHQFILGRSWVDHINGDGLDNRRCNLRLANRCQNMRNTQKRSGTTSSEFKGVFWSNTYERWLAQITPARKRMHLGYFLLEKDAARAYDAAARLHFGEYARTNFAESAPDDGVKGRLVPYAAGRASRAAKHVLGVVKTRHNRWRANIWNPRSPEEIIAGGKRINFIGTFPSEKEAALAYDARARELFGSAAVLNYPEVASV